MIDTALKYIVNALNNYIRVQLDINDDKVLLSNLIDQSGQVAISGENQIVVTLVNILHETATNNNSRFSMVSTDDSTYVRSYPPLNLNIYLLFSAHFTNDNYTEALKFLSYILGFFQSRNVFNKNNSPDLPAGIEKLIFDFEQMGFQELSHLFSAIGAKYIPSTIYRMRMLTIDEQVVLSQQPEISQLDTKASIN